MPARRMRNPAPDAGADDLRESKRGQIQALIDSPDLRRIFDREPAEVRQARTASAARRERAIAAPPTEDVDHALRVAARRRSRKTRIAVGLTPVYLALLILFLEIVREPTLVQDFFGTPSVAKEASLGSVAAYLHVAAAGAGSTEGASDAGSVDTPAPAPIEPYDRAEIRAPAPIEPDGRSVIAADAEIVSIVGSEKAASDLAKRAGRPPAEGIDAASGLSPAEPAAVPVAASDTFMQGRSPHAEKVADSVATSRPDPRAGFALPEAPLDPAAAAAAEQALGLSPSDRREVQRRLRFAAFDPQSIDGIFGPVTRLAIAAWQQATGLPATGYIDEPAMALLVEQTADDYRAWQSAERARARQEKEEPNAIVVSSTQAWPSAAPADGCRRLPSGEIAFGRDVGCNFRAFGQNFKNDVQTLKGSLRQLFQ